MVIAEDKGLSVAEAGKRIGVSKSTAWRLVQAGLLRSVRAGKRVIVPLSATNDYLSGNTSSSR
jgi:excisionase family DNA binding protein